MVTSSSADPDGKGSGAKRLFSEICDGYSREKLIAYWEGRLDADESDAIYAEVLHNPALREELSEVIGQLLGEFSEDWWDTSAPASSSDEEVQ